MPGLQEYLAVLGCVTKLIEKYGLEQFANWSGVFRYRWSLLAWHNTSRLIFNTL
jgi:hypothetical protein